MLIIHNSYPHRYIHLLIDVDICFDKILMDLKGIIHNFCFFKFDCYEYSTIYNYFFENTNRSNYEDFLDCIYSEFKKTMEKNVSISSNYDKNDGYHYIFNRFVHTKGFLSNMCMLSKRNKKNQIEEFHDVFSSIFRDICVQNCVLERVFSQYDSIYKQIHNESFESFKNHEKFEELSLLTSFLSFLYFQENDLLVQHNIYLFKDVNEAIMLNENQDCVSNILKLLYDLYLNEIQLDRLTFSSQIGDQLIQEKYKYIIDMRIFSEIYRFLFIAMNNGETEFCSLFYNYVSLQNVADNVYFQIEIIIRDIIRNSTNDLIKLSLNIQNLERILGLSFKNDSKIKSIIDRIASEYVNMDSKKMLSEIILYINSSRKNDCDISTIIPVLSRFNLKYELVIIHSSFALSRIQPYSYEKILCERKIIESFEKSSYFYDLKNLKELLIDAEQSSELHIGPVLVFRSALWPKPPPYPSPKILRSITDCVFSKYKCLFPNRVLVFPLSSWSFYIKYTNKRIVIVCDGVQAECLLYLNTVDHIRSESLLPFIHDSYTKASIISMLPSKLLTSDGKDYYLNNDFSYSGLLKLPIPIIETSKHIEQDILIHRNEVIDAMLTRVIKQHGSLDIETLFQISKQEIDSRIDFSNTDVINRINALTDRGFFSVENNCIKFIP